MNMLCVVFCRLYFFVFIFYCLYVCFIKIKPQNFGKTSSALIFGENTHSLSANALKCYEGKHEELEKKTNASLPTSNCAKNSVDTVEND